MNKKQEEQLQGLLRVSLLFKEAEELPKGSQEKETFIRQARRTMWGLVDGLDEVDEEE